MNETKISLIDAQTCTYSEREKIEKAVLYAINDLELTDDFLVPGMNILIKPNLVMDKNRLSDQGTDCLYTQCEVVKPVLDYIFNKLGTDCKVVVGDAPMQECNFEKIRGYKDMIRNYQKKGFDIQLVDFRELKTTVDNGVYIQEINDNSKGVIVNLGKDSEFYGENEETMKRFRITNYNPKILPTHHHGVIQEYYVSQYVLDADLIINMPKPKSHRKAGVTISLKNFVGANTRKEFLPHHTMGSTQEGGDEYKNKNYIHIIRSKLLDRRNELQFNHKYFRARGYNIICKVCGKILKYTSDDYEEGSWYGNNTISRTIVDLNRIVKYVDKRGVLQNTPQRKMLIIGDMIVSGEKEGPVEPTHKDVGFIIAGTNPVIYDEFVATLMGFDIKKIPTLLRARKPKGRLKIVDENETAKLPELNLHFEPTSGWKNHIER